jgi:hypothetical protein
LESRAAKIAQTHLAEACAVPIDVMSCRGQVRGDRHTCRRCESATDFDGFAQHAVHVYRLSLQGDARHLATIQRNLEFEAHLIDDLLDVARINKDRAIVIPPAALISLMPMAPSDAVPDRITANAGSCA